MKTKAWKRIISLLMCYALLMSSPINAIALTTDWEISAPELEDKASEVKLDAEVLTVIEKINAIGTVTYNDASKAKINAARAAYDALTTSQKEQVTNYGTLLAAETEWTVLLNANYVPDNRVIYKKDSGTINSTITWEIYSDGLLLISGTGAIPSYSTSSTAPWYQYADSITRIFVRDTVTSIGAFAFYGCSKVRHVSLPFVGESRTATGLKGTFGYIFGYTTNGYSQKTTTGSNTDSVYYKDTTNSDGYSLKTVSHTVGTKDTYNSTAFIPGACYASTVTGTSSWYTCADYGYKQSSSSSTTYYGNIRTYVFSIPTTLTTVNITDATHISDAAFNNCTYLTTINLNDGITSIGDYAFQANIALKNFTIPESVTNIGKYAFNYDRALVEVYIPNAVTSITERAFYGCTGMTKIVISKNATVIGDYAFYDAALKQLVIPEKVTSIGQYAFSKCTLLTEVNIPDSVTSMGQYVFAGNTKVTKYTIGSGLRVIPTYAFSNNTALKSITVPNTVTNIESFAFNGCSAIEEITLPFAGESRTATELKGTFGYIFGYSTYGYSQRTSTGSQSDSVYYKDTTNSDGYSLRTVSHTVGTKDTYNSTAFIPGACYASTATGTSSWYTCADYGYKSSSSSTTTYYGNIRTYSFSIPTTLKTVNITDATQISDAAFNNCTYITNINLNDGIEKIGAYAFQNNSVLKDFTIPETVKTIGAYAFNYDVALTEVYIPDAVTTIPEYAFYGCNKITKLVISKNVTSIGDYAFYNNAALKQLIIPEKVASIGQYAFSKCTTITEVNIPDSVTSIGQYVFAGNTKVTKYTIGSGLRVIPTYAFSNNTALKSIIVPNTVTKIESFAFNGCSSITEITLPFVGESRSAKDLQGTFGYIFGYSTNGYSQRSSNGSYSQILYYKNTSISKGYSETTVSHTVGTSTAYNNTTFIPGAIYSGTVTGTNSWYTCADYGYKPNSSSTTTYYGNIRTYIFSIPTTLKTVNITDATQIADAAFNNCGNITKITLNEGIKSVGAYAFDYVPWYTNQKADFVIAGDGVLIKYNGTASGVTLPEEVKYIAGAVFRNNTTISEVNIHQNVVGIGREAFDGCTNLTSLLIPKTVTSIGTDAIPDTCKIHVYRPSAGYDYRSTNRVVLSSTYITGNDTFYYIVNDDNCIEIIGCTTTSSELTVPTDIEGLIVNKIGDYGFSKCTTIKSITIPSNIISIGKYAFTSCTGLVNATIPTTVKSVGDYAFYNCTGLKNVTISEGVESIGEGAFYNCTSLVEAVVPDTAVKVGSHAFYNCTSMTTATIGISADAIGDYTFYNCKKLDTIVIGISVASIGDYAFYNCNLDKLSVPQTVTTIGKYAFASNDAMTRATLRKNLLTIGEGAFQDCGAMSTVSIPSSVTEIGKAAFENCASITTITLPVGVTVINDLVFSDCQKLATVKINGDVTSIGISAFYNCAFENITLPETVANIKASAFRKCTKLATITIPDATKSIGDSAFLDCSALATVSMPDDVKTVGDGVFFYNKDLTIQVRYLTGAIPAGMLEKQGVCHVILDENITTIGDRAFALCYSLKDITYGSETAEVGKYKFSQNVTSIGKETFVDDVLLKNLIIPDSLQTMGTNTIYNPIVTEYNCKDVTATIYYVNGSIAASILKAQDFSHIVVNDNIHTIGASAFYGGDQLVTISLPDTISTVGSSVFASSSGKLTATIRGVDGTIDASAYSGKTSGIQYLIIDENVNTIGANAFANASTIKGVVINDTAMIGQKAFYKGSALNYVEIGSTETIDANAFAECLALKRVEIDKVKAINDYAFFNCIAMNDIYIDSESGLEHIGEHTFEECKLMPSIALPATVNNIGAYAFYNCNSMTSINIPDGVPAINDYTFFGCASLKEMILPNSVITVGDWAFYGCVVVKKMTLGNQTTSIGEYAFYNCNKISTLQIPETVTEIGDYAFRSCSTITDLYIPDSVTSLGDCVFYSCTGLKQVEFGNGITTIGDRVFYACVELDKVIFNAPVEEIHDLAFYGAEDATLYAFEDEYVETYCNDFGLMYYDLGGDFTMTITAPTKTQYNEYEELNLAGLALNLTYTSGTERTIKTGYTISGYDPAVLGTQTITVTYKEVSATFDINVVAKTVSFITIGAGAPVDVIVGEELDVSAMVVKVNFADGTSVDLTEGYTLTGYDAETIGEQTITVTYRESSQQMTITVKDYVRGDTNGDGIVSMKDVTRLVNYLNDNSIAVIDKALDVNGDGIVSIKDVTRLTEYLEDSTIEIF